MKRWLQLSEECIKMIAPLLLKEESYTEKNYRIVDEFFVQVLQCDNVSEKGKKYIQLLYNNFLEVHEFRAKKLGWIENNGANNIY